MHFRVKYYTYISLCFLDFDLMLYNEVLYFTKLSLYSKVSHSIHGQSKEIYVGNQVQSIY